MHNLRARKRPPPRGEEGAGLRGERPLPCDPVAIQDDVRPCVSVEQQPLHLEHALAVTEASDDTAASRLEVRRDVGGAEHAEAVEVVVAEVAGRAVGVDDDTVDADVTDDPGHVPGTTEGDDVATLEAVGFCFVVHAHDPAGEPPPPQLHAASNSQATLPYPTVGSSPSGMPPTLGELGTPNTYGSSARRAASDIPRARQMVAPATVYTWHTAAQVGSSASDMPHGSGRRTCARNLRVGHL